MTLRPYQRDAVASVFEKFEQLGEQRTAGVAATGGGKTVIFSEVIREWRTRHPGSPVLVLAHRSELLSQAAEKIRLWAPGLRVGLVQAGTNQVWADVIVASQQTLQRQDRLDRLPTFGRDSLIVVDECHRSMSDSYQKVLGALGATDPDGPRVLGVTATFTREDSKRLTEFYQSVAFNIDILDLIDQGYLVPPKFRRVLVEGLDLSAVRSSRLAGGKDLAAGDLDAAMERAGAPGVVAAAYRLHAADRQGLVFTPTVHSAFQVRDALIAEGLSSAVISGDTAKGERAGLIRAYGSGQLQTVVNCAVLTEGFDAPSTSCVLIARPTLSKILFRQMVGRGLRLYCPVRLECPGCPACKTDALILDVVGATGRNDLKTLNDVIDRPVDIREGELLTDAVKRATQSAPATELIGDAMVSGSLSLAEIDPWEAERRAKLTRRELAAENGEQDADDKDSAPEAPKEKARKLRYAHVPQRSGWFLCSSEAGVWFIPCQPNPMQQGFVCVVPDHGRFHVAVCLPGIDWQGHLVTLDSEADAAQLALDLTLGLLPAPDQRAQIDPDARWRRRPATRAQLRLLEAIGTGDDFDVQYQGQAADLIFLAKQSRAVNIFADRVARTLATV